MFHVTWTTFKFNRNRLGTVSAYVMWLWLIALLMCTLKWLSTTETQCHKWFHLKPEAATVRGGALECNLTGRCPYLRISTTRLGKNFAFPYPVSELLNSKNNRENNGILFLKTIAYCSWTNNHNLFRNFWSIFIPRSGIFAEKWYSEKRHVPYRFIWKSPPWAAINYIEISSLICHWH